MCFKVIFSAVLSALCVVFAMNIAAFAEPVSSPDETDETVQETEYESGDLSALFHEYSDDLRMEQYSFLDGASFYCTSELSEKGNILPMFSLATDDDDVFITVLCDGEKLPEQNEYLLGSKGAYSVSVEHAMRDGSGTASAHFTAQITDSPVDTDRETIEGRIQLFQSDDGEFSHSFLDGSVLTTDVLDGETINYMPKFDVPEAVMFSLYKDGKAYPVPASGLLTEDGVYNAEFVCVDDDGNAETRYMMFSVFMLPTNRLGIYQPPYGFEIADVRLNGAVLSVDNPGFFKLDEQGTYEIEYTNGEVTRSAELTRDTLPPVLYFNGTSDVIFNERITVSSNEECTYSIKQNGQLIGKEPQLSGAGTFRVSAEDAAGNVTEVRVEILAVSAINPLDFVVVFGILVIAAVLYFIIQKNTRIKVR